MSIKNDYKYPFKMFSLYCLLSIVIILFMFPLLWLVLTSFKHGVDIWVTPVKWFFNPTLKNYIQDFTTFPKPLFNSLIIVTSTIILSVTFGLPAAYGLGRFNLKNKNNLAFWFLTQFILPPMAIIVPFYVLMNQINLLGTKTSLILAYSTFNLPLVVWMMKEFFEGIPKELDEAALVDGCNWIQSFIRISLPLVRQGIAITAVMCFIFSWNEYMFAVILSNQNSQTLPLLVGLYYKEYEISWGNIAALGVLTALPVAIFGVIIQRYLVQGLTLGAVKS